MGTGWKKFRLKFFCEINSSYLHSHHTSILEKLSFKRLWKLRKICNKINESLFPNKSEEYSSKWLFKRVDFFLDYPKRNISRNSGPLFRTTIQFVGAMHIFLEGCQKCLQYMYENCTLVSALWGSFFFNKTPTFRLALPIRG